MDSARRTAALPAVGFPIRKSPDQSLVSGSPKLIAATRVLHRLLSPRHPSCALSSLVIVSSRLALALRPDDEDQGPARSRTPGLTKGASVTLRAYSFLRICNCQRAHSKLVGGWNGADRDRTDDIQLAKLALSQLSYGPIRSGGRLRLPPVPPASAAGDPRDPSSAAKTR